MGEQARTPVDILREARARIADPEHFTQGAAARSAKGRQVKATSPRAVCWCASGTVAACGLPRDMERRVEDYLYLAAHDLYRQGLICVNDFKGHEAVLAVFDRAIEAAAS